MHPVSTSAVLFGLVAVLCAESSLATPVPSGTVQLNTRVFKEKTNFRAEAKKPNHPGAFVHGSPVHHGLKAKGHLERITGPKHVLPVLEKAGRGKHGARTHEHKKVSHHGNRLSMLKHKPTSTSHTNHVSKPHFRPKHGEASKDLMQHSRVPKKAGKTMKNRRGFVKHPGMGNVMGHIMTQNLLGIGAHPRRDLHPHNTPLPHPHEHKPKREIDEAWLYARSLEMLLDELD